MSFYLRQCRVPNKREPQWYIFLSTCHKCALGGGVNSVAEVVGRDGVFECSRCMNLLPLDKPALALVRSAVTGQVNPIFSFLVPEQQGDAHA
jgi:hypothetical protein